MDLIGKERDRLLQRSARVYGLGFTAVAALCLVLPGAVPLAALVVVLPLLVLVAGAQIAVGVGRAIWWPLLVIVAGTGVTVAVALLAEQPTAAASLGLINLGAAALPSVALVLTSSAPRIALLIAGAVLGVAAIVFAEAEAPAQALRNGGTVLVGGGLAALVTVWINAGVPQVAKRIASIGRAHRAERQASEP